MAKLRKLKMAFGTWAEPNALTDLEVSLLQKVAEEKQAGAIGASFSGWVVKDNGILTKSQYVLLQSLGIRIKSPAFESCHEDQFTLVSSKGGTVAEGTGDIVITSPEISTAVLRFALDKQAGISVTSRDAEMSETTIRSRFSLAGNVLTVAPAQENCAWQATATVTATPVYSYTDENGTMHSAEGTARSIAITAFATPLTGIRITGPEMVNGGAQASYEAALVPAVSTKQVGAVMFSAKTGMFNGNLYTAGTVEPADTIAATAYVYGAPVQASMDITVGVELMNDADKNPTMFGIIKSALNLDEDKHSFSVTDAMEVTNEQIQTIFKAWPDTMQPYDADVNTRVITNNLSFLEFKYFTSVTQILELHRQAINVKYIAFPKSLKGMSKDAVIRTNSDIVLYEEFATGLAGGTYESGIVSFGNVELAKKTSISSSCGIVASDVVGDGSNKILTFGNRSTILLMSSTPLDLRKFGTVQSNSSSLPGYITKPDAEVCIFPKDTLTLNYSIAGSTSLKYFRVEDGADSIELPASLQDIGYFTFKNCQSLQCSDFSHVLSIGQEAFFGCLNLNVQQLPPLKGLGYRAFYGALRSFTSNVMEVAFRTNVDQINEGYFDLNRSILWKVKGLSITDLRLAEQNYSVSSITWADLSQCSALTTITATVVSKLAFINLVSFNRVITLKGGLPTIVQRVYVPNNLVAKYKAATNWVNYAGLIYDSSQFVLDAMATLKAAYYSNKTNEEVKAILFADSSSDTPSEWTWNEGMHPFDRKYPYGLPTWVLAD